VDTMITCSKFIWHPFLFQGNFASSVGRLFFLLTMNTSVAEKLWKQLHPKSKYALPTT
jgi:hypothetical protein